MPRLFCVSRFEIDNLRYAGTLNNFVAFAIWLNRSAGGVQAKDVRAKIASLSVAPAAAHEMW